MQAEEPSPLLKGDLHSPATARGDLFELIAGKRAVYRIGFSSMHVIGLPQSLRIGQVDVRVVDGPVVTQRTAMVQQPGLFPTFEKWMEHMSVGAGRPITLFTLEVTIPDREVEKASASWRAEALAAAGFLAMVLDERLVQQQILEDVSVFDSDANVFAQVDFAAGIRTFEPSHPWFADYEQELGQFTRHQDPRLRTACRWYLRAVTVGPTADGIVLLWVTLESLVPAGGGGRSRNEVKAVEEALRRADPTLDPQGMIEPSIGQLAGLRARIVHQGAEEDALVRPGYYTLESLCRLLLRHEFRVTAGWPYFPAEPMLRPPLADMERPARTVWREPPANQ